MWRSKSGEEAMTWKRRTGLKAVNSGTILRTVERLIIGNLKVSLVFWEGHARPFIAGHLEAAQHHKARQRRHLHSVPF